MHTSAKTNFINLLTDSDLSILSGSAPTELMAPIAGDLTGKKISQLFPAVNPDILNNIQQICLQQPGVPCQVQLKVGVNGHARLFHWVVCASTQNLGEQLIWEGREKGTPDAADYSGVMRDAILERISEAVTTMDTGFRVTGLNKKAEELFGLQASKVIGTTVFDLHPARMEGMGLMEVLQQVQADGSWQGNYVWQQEREAVVVIEGHMSQVHDAEGRLVGYLSIDRDITHVHNSGSICNRSNDPERILTQIIDQSGATCWATDQQGNKHYYNKNFSQLLGVDNDDPARISVFDLFDCLTARRYMLENEEVINASKVNSHVEPAPQEGGKQSWYRTFKFPVDINKGMLAAGFGYDVTKEYLQQQELAYLRQRYEIAASITADIIGDWDIVNDRLWRSDPVRGIPVHVQKARSMQERLSRLHPDDKQRFLFSLNQALLSDKASWECEYRYVLGGDRQGYKVLHEKGVILRDETGEAIRMISVVHDVTEERRLNEEIRQKERQVIVATIEGQENERNELARELHDNVGQVLAMCKLFVEIAADSVQHDYMDKCRNHLEKAIQEIRSLSHRLSPELLDRKGLPGAVASLADNLGLAGAFTIDLFFSEDLHTVELEKGVQTAAYRIVQEAMNNILKHAKADKVWVHIQLKDKSLVVHIKDNGVGFDPIKVDGGIGLRNIYNRVEMAGGHIFLDTAPGAGCALKVILPMDK